MNHRKAALFATGTTALVVGLTTAFYVMSAVYGPRGFGFVLALLAGWSCFYVWARGWWW